MPIRALRTPVGFEEKMQYYEFTVSKAIEIMNNPKERVMFATPEVAIDKMLEYEITRTHELSLKQKEARFQAVDATLNKMFAELARLEKETMKTYALWLARQKIYYEADQKKKEKEDHDETITKLKNINMTVQQEMKRRRLEFQMSGKASRDASPWDPLMGLENFNQRNRPTDQFTPPRWNQNYARVECQCPGPAGCRI